LLLQKVMSRLSHLPAPLLARLPSSIRTAIKEHEEYKFWQRTAQGRTLTNSHFEWFFTTLFDLSESSYKAKRILDIGCGPRGSLEWAHHAAQRVGLDPLVDRYRTLGIDEHHMEYVCAPSESIPFPDGYFDIVSSFNSLDHVDNLEKTLREITRVTKTEGLFLVIVEINHVPTILEPITIDPLWLRETLSGFVSLQWRSVIIRSDHDIYLSVREGVAGRDNEPGILVAKLARCRPTEAS
jgi:SAM-dependent methyltransferase